MRENTASSMRSEMSTATMTEMGMEMYQPRSQVKISEYAAAVMISPVAKFASLITPNTSPIASAARPRTAPAEMASTSD